MCWICDASAPQCKLAMVESPADFCAGWDQRCRFIPHPWRKFVLQNEVPQPSTSEGPGKVKKSTPPAAPSRNRAKRPGTAPRQPLTRPWIARPASMSPNSYAERALLQMWRGSQWGRKAHRWCSATGTASRPTNLRSCSLRSSSQTPTTRARKSRSGLLRRPSKPRG